MTNRYQSNLSKRKFAYDEMMDLVRICSSKKKILAVSYGYPLDIINQKTDRYTLDVNKFIEAKPPYDSWILNADLKWESPKGPQPAHNFDWDEESQEWIDQPIKSE